MAKAKVSPAFRARFSEKMMDLGNLIAIALIFAPLVSGLEISFPLIIMGGLLMGFCYIIAYIVSK